MSARRIVAVVPIKTLAWAKARMQPLLDQDERAALAAAMARDVLQALAACAALSRLLVVTCDRAAADIASEAGADTLRMAGDGGYTAAVAAAGERLRRERRTAILVVPADVPLLRPETVERLIEGRRRGVPAVALVPAAADGGTNALLVEPPDVIPFRFGPSSFERHRAAARAAGAFPRVVHLPELALDLDRPDDLRPFLAVLRTTETRRLLDELGVVRRLRAAGAGEDALSGSTSISELCEEGSA